MKLKKVVSLCLTSIIAISMSCTAFAITYTNKNVSTFHDQRVVGKMRHTAWNGWTGTAPSPDGYSNGYGNRYKVAAYQEYKDSSGHLVLIHNSGYIGGTSSIVKTNPSHSVSSECVKRHHYSCIHVGSNPDSLIKDVTTTNVFINNGNY